MTEISNSESETTDDLSVTRRELIKLAASAIIVPAQRRGQRPVLGRFFSADELAMMDELCELIIPADEHSPGARAAKTAQYIGQRLAEDWDEGAKQEWRDGLKSIDQLSKEMHGRPFLKTTPDQRVALLERISQNEANPQKPEEKFFVELKGRTANAYYTSKIGVHDEIEYLGNTYQREFSGEDVSSN